MPEGAVPSHTKQRKVSQQKKKPSFLLIEQSLGLDGEVSLIGAKNATLVIIASLILTKGVSVLHNVPASEDVFGMLELMTDLGATVVFDGDANTLEVDTRNIDGHFIKQEIMKKMRASILVMGPLLARFKRAHVAIPGGCVLGARPIDYHIQNFEKMGVKFSEEGHEIKAKTKKLMARNLLLEYPSVGATENLVMAATLTQGITRIINAALEPEVFDFLEALKKMGARIEIEVPSTIKVTGVKRLKPITHAIILDRLEAGSLLLAGAITGGYVSLPTAPAHSMGLFLMKLQEVGHTILIGRNGTGVKIKATKNPQAVSIKTAPYPGYPTDLQAPFMSILCLARGKSVIKESVFEHRLVHGRELSKMGAQVDVEYDTAIVHGVDELYGCSVIASDIRASCALVLAGLVAKGTTMVTGIHHWKRGYQELEKKLQQLGAQIELHET